MSDIEQLRGEVSELRTAVLNIGWHLDKIRNALAKAPKGQDVNEQPNLQGTFSNLVRLCYEIGSIQNNTPHVEGAAWCKALLAREGAPAFEQINRNFYAAQNAAIEAKAAKAAGESNVG